MAVKKSDLYSSLWASCDELRGGMDASQYKDYVLVLLFVKYVSDRHAGKPFAPITIPPGASFADMVALKGRPDIGDQINKKILGPLAQANQLADMPDFNDPNKLGSGKEMVDRLTNLVAIFENPALDFSQNRADGDDLLGDAYEYLMRHFATESGKSKGQFYTPAEVSRVIARILGVRTAPLTNQTSVYDPTCGSGSLLLKIGEEARHGPGRSDLKVSLYGQEKDNATAGLARMNMILHDYATAEIKQGNTLANPLFKNGDTLAAFDYVVANPPFSDKRWSSGLHPDEGGQPVASGQTPPQNFGRFEGYGVPPAKQGDYAYLLHILRSLKSTGQGACILPHGVLFRGNAEAAIRRSLIRRGVLRGIIGLPANLFYGTGIPACILVLDKAGAASRQAIFMIDASRGFIKDGNKNRLREQDIHKIVDIFTRQTELPRYSRLVPVAEIADPKNDYNLNLPRYIGSGEPEDLQDIGAHLRGGIPDRDLDALADYWRILPSVRVTLFAPKGGAGSPNTLSGYSTLRLPLPEVKSAILGQPEFQAFQATVHRLYADWSARARPRLASFARGGHPKPLVETLSEELLSAFRSAPLLDPYAVYQHLMDRWTASMQDDVYLVADDGWVKAAQPVLIVDDKKAKTKTRPDLVLGRKKYTAELLPPAFLVRRHFAADQAAIEQLETEVAALQQQLDELVEEHAGDDGLLTDALNDKGKLTQASAKARLKELADEAPGRSSSALAVAEEPAPYGDAAEPTELALLLRWVNLANRQLAASAKLSAAQDALTEKLLAKYPKLTEDEIKTLVVDDKWLGALAADLRGELDRVSQSLTGRIRQLAERYATPLADLETEIAGLAAKVDGHLEKMEAACR